MVDFFQDFAQQAGLSFEYEYDDKYDAHRFIFTKPKEQKRWAYMIHTPELKKQESNNYNGFVDFIVENAMKLL